MSLLLQREAANPELSPERAGTGDGTGRFTNGQLVNKLKRMSPFNGEDAIKCHNLLHKMMPSFFDNSMDSFTSVE